MRRILALAAVLTALSPAGIPASAAPPPWHDIKCARYARAWSEALARMGTGGLSRDFLDRHAAFLVSNCTLPSAVCPRSAEELALANVMVIRAMNAGTASTFPPFLCHPAPARPPG